MITSSLVSISSIDKESNEPIKNKTVSVMFRLYSSSKNDLEMRNFCHLSVRNCFLLNFSQVWRLVGTNV